MDFDDFDELYQEIILDHSRNPRNFGDPPGAQVHVHGDNPMCGDEVSVHLALGEGKEVSTIGFTGNGCSICMASASIMTTRVKGKPAADASEMADHFQQMLISEQETESDKRLGDARVLKTVRKFPQRVKCATLAWHALKEALGTAADGGAEGQFSLEDEKR